MGVELGWTEGRSEAQKMLRKAHTEALSRMKPYSAESSGARSFDLLHARTTLQQSTLGLRRKPQQDSARASEVTLAHSDL